MGIASSWSGGRRARSAGVSFVRVLRSGSEAFGQGERCALGIGSVVGGSVGGTIVPWDGAKRRGRKEPMQRKSAHVKILLSISLPVFPNEANAWSENTGRVCRVGRR